MYTDSFRSDIVFPVKDKLSLDESNQEFQSGKYEPLANMNGLLRQEIKKVIFNIASIKYIGLCVCWLQDVLYVYRVSSPSDSIIYIILWWTQ